MDNEISKELPIIGILRGICHEDVAPLTDAILRSGLKTIEVSMNTSEEERHSCFSRGINPARNIFGMAGRGDNGQNFSFRFFCPKYFRNIKGPLNDIKLSACGGVTADNIKEYFLHGVDAVALGTSIFKDEWLKSRQYQKVAEEIQRLIMGYKG